MRAIVIAVLALAGLQAASAAASPPSILRTRIASPTTHSVVLEADLTTGGKATKYHFEYDTVPYGEGEPSHAHGTSTPEEQVSGLESQKTVSAPIEGLSPNSTYHFRLVAKNTEGEPKSPDRAFSTFQASLGSLPDQRAYEQASPTQKDGGDALGVVPFVKAAFSGNAITFASTSGIPGGEGAQELPFYLADRSGEGSGASWTTQGLLPAAGLGDAGKLLGWTPDFSRIFTQATKYGIPNKTALFSRSRTGKTQTQITPYLDDPNFHYAGSSANDGVAVFESEVALGAGPTGVAGKSNVYAWDGSSTSLASVFNDETPAEKGAFAGPYDWAGENTARGGAARLYYTQDEHAVAEDGSTFFTTAGSGHIYLREHPTAPQSEMEGEHCKDPAKACTIDVSPSRRTPPDPGGERPRAFQAASADGKTAFFTSPEELTNDANTGPELESPAIGRATLSGPEEEAGEPIPELLAENHAVGIAVQGQFIYWADTTNGTIGRAKLEGTEAKEVNDEYVSREEIEVPIEDEEGNSNPSPPPATSPSAPVPRGGMHLLDQCHRRQEGRRDDRPGEAGGKRSRRSTARIHHRRDQPAGDRGQLAAHLLGELAAHIQVFRKRPVSDGRRSTAGEVEQGFLELGVSPSCPTGWR